MSKNTNALAISYMLFLLLLTVSGCFSGLFARVVNCLAFLIPVFLALFLTPKDKTDRQKYLTINKKGAAVSAPLIFPTVFLVIIISFITTLIISTLTGRQNSVELGDSYLLALINHALLPAILEEALFRYLPMRLLAPYSPRGTIVLSSLFFALLHTDVFTIPYALFAGMVFMSVNLATDSIIPSIVIHLINNALSVTLMYIDRPDVTAIIYATVTVAAIISVVFIIIRRKSYVALLNKLTERGEGVPFTVGAIVLTALTLLLTVMKLF